MPSSDHVLRLSSALYWFCTFLLATTPVVVFAGLAFGWNISVADQFPNLPQGTILTPPKCALVTALGGMPLLLMIYMTWQMRRLLGRYRAGEILTHPCAQHILRIGQSLILLSILLIALPTLQMLVLTFGNAPGLRMLTIGIDGSVIGLGLVGGVLQTIGWVMREATREIESFV